MMLYHGSEHIIEKPVWHGGKRYNDYGYGFYMTEEPDLGREWAVGPDHDGFLNCYEMDDDGFHILDLVDGRYNALNWLEILLENRTFSLRSPLAVEASRYLRENFSIDYENMDIMVGYRADDSYFRFAQDFLNGVISYEQLCRCMKLGKLGIQIVARSRKAIEALRFQGYETVSRDVWYPRKESREKKARMDYADLDKNRFHRSDLYMIRILDEEVKPGDPRL